MNRRLWIPGASIAAYAAGVTVARDAWLWTLAAPLALIPLLRWLLASANAWLIPFFMVALAAPPMPIVATAVAAVGLAAGLMRIDEWRFQRAFLPAALILFFAVLAISLAPALLESGAEIASQSLARLALAGIALYVFFYTSAGPGRGRAISLDLIYWVAVISAACACVDFFYQLPAPAGTGQQFIWLDTGVFRRAQGLFYEASTLGNFCAFFIAMTAVALVKRIGNRVTLAVGGAVFIAALLFSYSRSSLINVGIAIAALLWVERKHAAVRRIAVTSAVSVAVTVAVLALIFPEYMGALWVRLKGTFDYALAGDAVLLSGRIDSWKVLGKFLLDHPWHLILGVGYKTLPYSDFVGTRVVADNMYLSALVEAGVGGLAALIAMNWTIVRAGYHAARSADREKSFYGTWIFCFWIAESVQMMSADLLTFWRVLPVYFWVLAMSARDTSKGP